MTPKKLRIRTRTTERDPSRHRGASTMWRQLVYLAWILGPVSVGLIGSGAPARQADPAVAREILRRALEAWQSGEPLDSFQKTRPFVTFVEPNWRKGTRLVKYDLKSDPTPS